MNDSHATHFDLQVMAQQIMLEHGFEPNFPAAVLQQLADIRARPPLAAFSSKDVRDVRNLFWSSIDNDTSRDLDQIEVAERLASGDVKVLVGIATAQVIRPGVRYCECYGLLSPHPYRNGYRRPGAVWAEMRFALRPV